MGRELPRLKLMWADGAYSGEFRRWAEEELGWRVEVPYHCDRQLWRYGLEEKRRGFPGSAPTLGGRENLRLRVAEPGPPSEQGL